MGALMTHLCPTCDAAPLFPGFDDCLKCAVASLLVEQPDYIDFARKTYRFDRAWLEQVEGEWTRQAGAIACWEAA
jgi:hypothetical protein